MSCTLGKFDTYSASKVGFDVANQSYRVELAKPTATCPEGIFFSKKAQLVVTPGAQATLAYNNKINRPVITVPSKEFVFNFNEPETLGLGSLFFGTLVVFGTLAIAYRLFKFFAGWKTATEPVSNRYDETYNFQEHVARSGAARDRLRSNNQRTYTSTPTTTVVNNSNDNLLTGVLLGSLLSNHGNDVHATHTPVGTLVESNEPVSTFSSDDSGSGSSYSSDSNSSDSYSSDSSSSSSDSYSSDSSSSYDSGSSFSSDSGGGFDSGGSFGSDS